MTEQRPTPQRLEVSPATVYAEGLAAGQLRYQRCENCGRAVFYPRVACPHCGEARLTWADSAGLGTVYSTTVTRSRAGDYNVALIDLDEGYRMMCTVTGDDVRIDDRVVAVVPAGTTAETLFFRRAGES